MRGCGDEMRTLAVAAPLEPWQHEIRQVSERLSSEQEDHVTVQAQSCWFSRW